MLTRLTRLGFPRIRFGSLAHLRVFGVGNAAQAFLRGRLGILINGDLISSNTRQPSQTCHVLYPSCYGYLARGNARPARTVAHQAMPFPPVVTSTMEPA